MAARDAHATSASSDRCRPPAAAAEVAVARRPKVVVRSAVRGRARDVEDDLCELCVLRVRRAHVPVQAQRRLEPAPHVRCTAAAARGIEAAKKAARVAQQVRKGEHLQVLRAVAKLAVRDRRHAHAAEPRQRAEPEGLHKVAGAVEARGRHRRVEEEANLEAEALKARVQEAAHRQAGIVW